MIDDTEIGMYYLRLESRLTRAETSLDELSKNIREIRKDLRWILRLIVGSGATIIGILIKGLPLG